VGFVWLHRGSEGTSGIGKVRAQAWWRACIGASPVRTRRGTGSEIASLAPMQPGSQDLHAFAARVLIVLGLVALALFLWRVADVLLLIFGASLVAILLRTIADPLMRWMPERVALGVAVLAILLVIGGTALLFGTEIRSQLSELMNRLPGGWKSVEALIAANEIGAMLLDALRKAGPDFSAIAVQVTQAGAIAAGAVVQLLIVAFGGLYLAGSPDIYRNGLLKLFPEGGRERVAGVIDASARALRLWLLGQLITMIIVGLLTGLGLWLIGVPAPLALGLLAGLFEFIPYIGPILAAIPGILIALTVGFDIALLALLVYVVVQQVESNAVVPLVARQVLALPPALAVFSVIALGLVFGPLGFVFAAPLTVLLVVAIGKLYVRETLGASTSIPGEKPGKR
jgi:predicted PurR-regulated permease PerM